MWFGYCSKGNWEACGLDIVLSVRSTTTSSVVIQSHYHQLLYMSIMNIHSFSLKHLVQINQLYFPVTPVRKKGTQNIPTTTELIVSTRLMCAVLSPRYNWWKERNWNILVTSISWFFKRTVMFVAVLARALSREHHTVGFHWTNNQMKTQKS